MDGSGIGDTRPAEGYEIGQVQIPKVVSLSSFVLFLKCQWSACTLLNKRPSYFFLLDLLAEKSDVEISGFFGNSVVSCDIFLETVL